MAKHARLGPSGAWIWTACTASPRESDGKPNEGNDASRIGTACHEIVARCLQNHEEPPEFFQREFVFCVDTDNGGARVENFREDVAHGLESGILQQQHVVTIDSDMVDHCIAYVNFVRELAEVTGAEMLVEQRVPIDHMTGEDEAGGTSDVILFYQDTLHIVDAKFGRVHVSAYDMVKPALPHPITGEIQPPVLKPNPQMAMYAGGALHAHGLMHDIKRVRMTIVQPPLANVSEYEMPVEDLEEFLRWIAERAEATRTNPQYQAGDHCVYCRGRVTCKARDEYVLTSALEGFEDATDPVQVAAAQPRVVDSSLLGVYWERLGTIQKWIDDLGERVMNALRQGDPVVGASGEHYKLVAGKNGARKWTDEKEVEKVLKNRMRLRNDEMYEFVMLSPPKVEERLVKVPKAKKGQPQREPVLGERQWTTLQKFITRAEPAPQIAPGSDPRPALPSVTEGFEDVSQPSAADTVDFFN